MSNTTERQTPTEGAMRAARRILGEGTRIDLLRETAGIIDAETGVKAIAHIRGEG